MELLQNQKKTHTNTVSRSVTKEQKQFNGERVLLKKKKKKVIEQMNIQRKKNLIKTLSLCLSPN